MQVRLNITLDADVSRELDNIANELGEKKSDIIEKALTAYFDALDLKLAEKNMKELEEHRDSLINADDVWKDIGIC